MALSGVQPPLGGLLMRKLTREEFETMIDDEYPELAGVTEDEIDTMFYFFNLGRKSVRW